MFDNPARMAQAGLVMLIVLQAVMLMALFAAVPPHPPTEIPLGGIAPILAASFAAAAAALILGPLENRLGQGFACVAALISLLSFGPQKYFDAQFGLIWPAIVTGQIAVLMVVVAMVVASREPTKAQVAVR